ncbi:MAG: hypothetical protein IJ859_01160 [Synergistaceae bacterium]|nr:hypothetical protein [Synergistaceae bacterium]
MSHTSTWSGFFKKWWNDISNLSKSEPTSQNLETLQAEKQANREKAERISSKILATIETSGDLYCLDFTKNSSDSEIIWEDSNFSELNFYDENINFLDSEKLLSSLKEICSDDPAVRSNKRFMCVSNVELSDESLEMLLKNIADDSVFNFEKIANSIEQFRV